MNSKDTGTIESLADECGLAVAFKPIGTDWIWWVERDGMSVFEGSKQNAVMWLKGYSCALKRFDKILDKKLEETYDKIREARAES